MFTKKYYNKIIKVVLIGDGGVGKTSFVHRHVTGIFDKRYIATLGVEVHPVVKKNVTYNCWDIAGQEKYNSHRDTYYIGAQYIIIMFDVTSKNSFKNVSTWLKEARKIVLDTNIVLCGNKVDCDESSVKVSSNDIMCWKRLHPHIRYYNISAKNNYNLDDPLLYLGDVSHISTETEPPTEPPYWSVNVPMTDSGWDRLIKYFIKYRNQDWWNHNDELLRLELHLFLNNRHPYKEILKQTLKTHIVTHYSNTL
jgi:GTP-binding nuclear protein Ran